MKNEYWNSPSEINLLSTQAKAFKEWIVRAKYPLKHGNMIYKTETVSRVHGNLIYNTDCLPDTRKFDFNTGGNMIYNTETVSQTHENLIYNTNSLPDTRKFDL